jgi:hypothetical protein
MMANHFPGHTLQGFGVFLGQAAIFPIVCGFSFWVPTLFIRTCGWSASRIGRAFGLLMAVFGVIGVTLGPTAAARITDQVFRNGATLRRLLPLPIAAVLHVALPTPLWGREPHRLAVREIQSAGEPRIRSQRKEHR